MREHGLGTTVLIFATQWAGAAERPEEALFLVSQGTGGVAHKCWWVCPSRLHLRHPAVWESRGLGLVYSRILVPKEMPSVLIAHPLSLVSVTAPDFLDHVSNLQSQLACVEVRLPDL